MGRLFVLNSMTTPTRPIPVTLRKNLRRTLSRGHPWVYRDALDHPPHLADGTLVELRTGDRRAAGVGYWDGRSSIAVRMLSPGSLSDAEATLRERLRASLRLRLDRLDLRRTNAFRWVHGEADRLPGIHVDLYDDVAVVRFDGAGARAFYVDLGASLAQTASPLPLRSAIDRQTGARLFGGSPPNTLVVLENGLRFEASPGVGGKGGLFLDQRENRERVEGLASGGPVLELVGRAGGFSVSDATAGARPADTVETPRPPLP